MLANVLADQGQLHQKLKILDISNNDITEEGVDSLVVMLAHLELNVLNLSKNHIGDNGLCEML